MFHWVAWFDLAILRIQTYLYVSVVLPGCERYIFEHFTAVGIGCWLLDGGWMV